VLKNVDDNVIGKNQNIAHLMDENNIKKEELQVF